jgi:hypothetical protein
MHAGENSRTFPRNVNEWSNSQNLKYAMLRKWYPKSWHPNGADETTTIPIVDQANIITLGDCKVINKTTNMSRGNVTTLDDCM